MTDAWQPPNAPPEQPSPPTGSGIPWEREQTAQSLFETLKVVLLQPEETFSTASENTGFGPAFMYSLVCGVTCGVAAGLIKYATTSAALPLLNFIPPEMRPSLEPFLQPSLAGLVAVPFVVVIGLFVGAGILHLALMLLSAANGRFEDTVRAVAYASGSVAVFQLIPVIGPLAAGIWAIVIEIYAVKALHKTTGGKAALAVLSPLLLAVLCCCCLGIVFAGMLGSLGLQK